MKPSLSLSGAGLLIASICAAAAGAAAPSATPSIHDMMKSVSTETQIIWDIGNNNQDDAGNVDPKKLKDADWSRAVSAGETVKKAAVTMENSKGLAVVSPGQHIHDEGEEGTLDVKTIQKLIDSDPKAFATHARSLAAAMDEVIASAKAHNAAAFGDVSGRLDQVCESCHMQFWYPPQK